jgi:hypothetical protein
MDCLKSINCLYFKLIIVIIQSSNTNFLKYNVLKVCIEILKGFKLNNPVRSAGLQRKHIFTTLKGLNLEILNPFRVRNPTPQGTTGFTGDYIYADVRFKIARDLIVKNITQN